MDAPFVPPRLGPTTDKISHLLEQSGASGVDVEIVFLDKSFRPSWFSISTGDPAVVAFEVAREEILKVVNRAHQSEWNMLTLFRMGLTKAKSSPTIVVFVNPFTIKGWFDLASRSSFCCQQTILSHCGLRWNFSQASFQPWVPARNLPLMGSISPM
ncbi:uncharacterized protein BJX67DRAFT_362835, partial [Aspergillus lucknowensis]